MCSCVFVSANVFVFRLCDCAYVFGACAFLFVMSCLCVRLCLIV